MHLHVEFSALIDCKYSAFVCALQLTDTKSSDKKMTLLHFIVKTVQTKFPDIANFDTELKYIEKAATGCAPLFFCHVMLKSSNGFLALRDGPWLLLKNFHYLKLMINVLSMLSSLSILGIL